MDKNIKENISLSIKSRYRPEIDGLRAFAVIAVIINHFNTNTLPSGYLGVDIFFVISGFVITSSLYQRPSKNFKDFVSGFYARRIKRLVPALSVFVLITGFLICLFNPTPFLSLHTGFATLFGFSNLFLLGKSTNYFAQSTQLNPFTHTWSLSVEEQFYIIFPLLIWFSGFGQQTKNGARNLFILVGGLSIASLIIFLYLYPINQPAAYFLMPTRFWEMSAGCLIFLGFNKRPSLENFLEKVPPSIVIFLIIGVMFLPISSAPFSKIAIVLLTFFLLSSLKKPSFIFKVFTNKTVVNVGIISYSLYLWHWGVLTISRWTIGIYWWTVPFQIFLIIGLAICSYKFIEEPFRKDQYFKPDRFFIYISGIGLIFFTSMSLLSFKKFTPPKYGKPISLQGSAASLEKCMRYEMKECLNRTNDKKAVFAIGDSHLMNFVPSMRNALKELNMDLYSWGNTNHIRSIFNHKNEICLSKECVKDEIKEIIEVLTNGKFGRGDIFAYSISRNRLYLNREYSNPTKFYNFEGKSRNGNENLRDIELLKWTINELVNFAVSAGGYAVLIDDIPLACNSKKFNARFDECSTPKTISISDRQPLSKLLNTISAKNQNIFYLDPHNSVCTGSICQSSLNGVALYTDTSPHIAYESRYVLKDFFKENFDLIIKSKLKN